MAKDPKNDQPKRNELRRTWAQRLLIAGLSLAGVGCFVSASLIYVAQQALEARTLVTLPQAANAVSSPGPGESLTIGTDPVTGAPVVESAPETFPQAEPGARNILITGADNNACLDPDSPYAPAFGDREGLGERSDTIMMWRVNPATNQVAVLSFPRDLWLKIDGRSSKGRINEAYERDNPQRLINTIQQNFGIVTDHFV